MTLVVFSLTQFVLGQAPPFKVYRNESFRFQITVPIGLSLAPNSPGGTLDSTSEASGFFRDHGRVITLHADAVIQVWASYVVIPGPDTPLPTLVYQRLQETEAVSDSFSFQVTELSKSRLGDLDAYRYRCTFEQDSRPRIVEGVVAEHIGGHDVDNVEFFIQLATDPSHFKADVKQYQAILKSWRLTH